MREFIFKLTLYSFSNDFSASVSGCLIDYFPNNSWTLGRTSRLLDLFVKFAGPFTRFFSIPSIRSSDENSSAVFCRVNRRSGPHFDNRCGREEPTVFRRTHFSAAAFLCSRILLSHPNHPKVGCELGLCR